MKALLKFLKGWPDLWLLIPLALTAFLTATFWLPAIDPTAAVVSAEILGVLALNILMLLVVSSMSYILLVIAFGFDPISKERFDKYTNQQQTAITLTVWLSLLIVTWLTVTRNL